MGNSPSRPAPAAGGREPRRESNHTHSNSSTSSSNKPHSSNPPFFAARSASTSLSSAAPASAASQQPLRSRTYPQSKPRFHNDSNPELPFPAESLEEQDTENSVKMGNEQSRQKQQQQQQQAPPPQQQHQHGHHKRQPSHSSAPAQASHQTSGSASQHSHSATSSSSSQRRGSHYTAVQRPADEPSAETGNNVNKHDGDLAALPSELEQEQERILPSQYSRPPRLPLPIEEEVYTPGSPIISPADLSLPIDPESVDGVLPRRTSVLSSTTVDDDDIGDDELRAADGMRPAVPTIIEWKQGGEKVYVTGTFARWDRKYRLHKDGPSKHKDALSATINLQPGTHHLKFIVDGDMRLSEDLPTAVDFTNILVNYLEVSPDDLPQPPSEPVEIPSAKPVPESRAPPRGETVIPPGLHPPLTIPPTPELRAVVQDAAPPTPLPSTTVDKPAAVTTAGPPKAYHSVVPRFLADLDAPEDSSRFARANAAANTLPAPPSLPLFLSKSILNMSTPMKDDSSVLMHPNHTVLNHLATSSIRSHVLATSATTRYKRKFLTTIMYKPTSDVGE